MKKIFLSLCIIFSINSFAQDSAKLKPQITIQARDCEVILSFARLNKKLQDLDSVLLTKFRPPATAPTGTTNVVVDGVEARAWLEAMTRCGDNTAVVRGGTFDRVKTALLNSGHSWLVTKVNNEAIESDAIWVFIRVLGRKDGKKEEDGFENQ